MSLGSHKELTPPEVSPFRIISHQSKEIRIHGSHWLLLFSPSSHIEKDIDKRLPQKWRALISRTRSAIPSIVSYLKGKLCLLLQSFKSLKALAATL